MDLGSLILQNFFGIVASVIGAVVSYLVVRILRASQRTEEHARATEAKISALDRVSLTTHDAELEQWQQNMALRIEAVADAKSDSLAWQAQFDRRLAAVEKFAQELDDFAHGHRDV